MPMAGGWPKGRHAGAHGCLDNLCLGSGFLLRSTSSCWDIFCPPLERCRDYGSSTRLANPNAHPGAGEAYYNCHL